MGDRVAVMRKGELQQVAPPQELYDRPVNLFVGGFIGSPAMNMLDATVARQNGGVVARPRRRPEARARRRLPRRRTPPSRATTAGTVVLGIRPEALEEASLARDAPATRRLRGRVELREALGSELMVHFAIPEAQARADTEETKELARESSVEGGLETAGALVVGRLGAARARRGGGERRGRGRHAASLHFFDPETGLGIYEQRNEKGAAT